MGKHHIYDIVLYIVYHIILKLLECLDYIYYIFILYDVIVIFTVIRRTLYVRYSGPYVVCYANSSKWIDLTWV
jgi:hypothetical protein